MILPGAAQAARPGWFRESFKGVYSLLLPHALWCYKARRL